MQKESLLIFIMMIGTFGIVSTELGIIGILPQIAENFNISINQAGLFVSSFSLIIAVSSLFVPVLFSRYNRKYVFLFVLGVFTIATFVSSVINDFYIGLLCRIIPAFFYPAYCSLTFTVASEILPADDVQMGVSKILMGVSAGTIVGVPITSFFATSIGYQAAMLWFSVINLVTFVLTLIFFPDLEGKISSNLEEFKTAKNKVFIIASVGVIVLSTGVCVAYCYISQFLQTVPRILDLELSLTLFLFGISSILGTWIGGKLLSSKPTKTSLVYPFVLSFLMLILYFVGYFKIPTIVCVVFWGVLDGIMNNILQYWIVSAAPDHQEFANGIFFSMMNIGITLGTFIGGLLIVSYGTMSIFLGSIVVLLLSFVFLLMRVRSEDRVVLDV